MMASAMAMTDEAPAKILSPTRDTGFMRDAAVGFRCAVDVVSAMGFLRRVHGCFRGLGREGVVRPPAPEHRDQITRRSRSGESLSGGQNLRGNIGR